MKPPKTQKAKGSVNNMAQAAAMLGIEAHEVKRAKELGCLAFLSNRIYLRELNVWLCTKSWDTDRFGSRNLLRALSWVRANGCEPNPLESELERWLQRADVALHSFV